MVSKYSLLTYTLWCNSATANNHDTTNGLRGRYYGRFLFGEEVGVVRDAAGDARGNVRDAEGIEAVVGDEVDGEGDKDFIAVLVDGDDCDLSYSYNSSMENYCGDEDGESGSVELLEEAKLSLS